MPAPSFPPRTSLAGGLARGGVLAPAFVLAAALLNPAQAEDIDIYAASTAAASNLLIVLDNTSNWANASQGWTKDGALARCGTNQACRTETEAVFGTSSSLRQGQVEVRALKRVIQRLVCTTNEAQKFKVNVGIMLLSASKGSVTGDSSWVGGWLLKAVAPGTLDNCTALMTKLDEIDAQITAPSYTAASNAHYGGAMFEAFKYFGGHTNPAGARTGTAGSPVQPFGFGTQRYTSPYSLEDPAAFTSENKLAYKSPGSDCGLDKNYLVLVGNTWPDQEPTTTGSSAYDRALLQLGYNIGQVTPTNSNKIRYADEWAHFMANTDVSHAAGVQNIITYTLNVYNNNRHADQTALLRSMARVGGAGEANGYFEIDGSVGALVTAFADIFSSIAAVNTVFASASLPVSVNTQGTYLNQVFMGMFRPDAEARPRWAGNLKQYQFGRSASGGLFLADRDGLPAINTANTGFINSCRSSFWTSDSNPYWLNVPLRLTPPTQCATAPSTASLSDEPDGEIVEKGATAQLLRARLPSTRVLRTCASLACSSLVEFNTSSATSLAGELGVSAPSDELVQWIRGVNVGDGPQTSLGWELYGTLGTSVARPSIHGDVVHARPLAVNYGSSTSNNVVVYYGAGDGWLRAVDGRQQGSGAGSELWGFFAPEFLTRMSRLRENTQLISFPTVTVGNQAPKDYFFDGSIGAYMERSSSGVGKLFLYPTMRRGGRLVYAFDATQRPEPGQPSTLPRVKWKFGCANRSHDGSCTAGASAIGQTWSTPRAFRVKGSDTVYLVFGGGYDNCEDTDSCGTSSKGQGLFILNADSGALVSYINLAAISADAGRVIAEVVPADVNGDGRADVLYAVDTRGNVWRVNLSDRDADFITWQPSDWSSKTYRIAKVANWGSSSWLQRRKFQYAPDLVVLGDTAWVLVGTGDREQPLLGANASKVKNRFYGFRDNLMVGGRSNPPSPLQATPGLIDDSADCDAAGDAIRSSGCHLLNVTTLGLDYRSALADPATRGWTIDLSSTAEPFEHVVTTPVTVGGYVYFSTYQAGGSPTDACGLKLGTSRGYAVNFLDGSKRPGDLARETQFRGGGFAPSPVAGIVEIDGRKQAFLLGGRDGASFLEVAPPQIATGARRRKLYRYETIDSR